MTPGTEITLAYWFLPDPLSIDPVEYGFICRVFYHDEANNNYSSVFFNSTILLAEPESAFETEQ